MHRALAGLSMGGGQSSNFGLGKSTRSPPRCRCAPPASSRAQHCAGAPPLEGASPTTIHGSYLVSQEDWHKEVAQAIAATEGLTLAQDHLDVIEYLRDAYFNHNGEQPNNRAILKAMQDKWCGRKVDNKTLFDLYPGNPPGRRARSRGCPRACARAGTKGGVECVFWPALTTARGEA
jgi:tRNA 2-thiouridine synthesizing protein E